MTRILFFSVIVFNSAYSQTITINGWVKQTGSDEVLPFASIAIKGTNKGTFSNSNGFYSLQVPANQDWILVCSMVGHTPSEMKVNSTQDHVINFYLPVLELDEVIVKGNATYANRFAKNNISLHLVKKMPALLGEKDLIKSLQVLPGVQAGIEGSTGINVRGGTAGQNLILLDGTTVYNINHLFGFFSVFNADAIKHVNFWKSRMPARYGGRVSSFIDIQLLDGNKQKLKAAGGIGLLSSRFTLDGPLKKGKSSFLLSARRSYLDLFLSPFMADESKTLYQLTDLVAKANIDIDQKNNLTLSAFHASDKVRVTEKIERSNAHSISDSELGWKNATAAVQWNHVFNKKLCLNTVFSFSDYKFLLSDSFSKVFDGQMTEKRSENSSGIRDYAFKTDFDYFLSNNHHLKFGALIIHHHYQPKGYSASDATNQAIESSQEFKNVEFAFYWEDDFQITNKLSTNFGTRFGGVLDANTDSYFNIEPRISLDFQLSKSTAIHSAYSRTNQYMHLLSNTGLGLPTDLWVPVTQHTPAVQADQYALGVTGNIPHKSILISVETYRKYLRNIITYKDGATFLSVDDAENIDWEENVSSGKGWSYGTEFLVSKNEGRLQGLISYTLSWAINQFADINQGKRFYANTDRRHAISMAGSYKLSPKVNVSANWTFNAGNPLNVPQGFYHGNFATGADIKGVWGDTVTYEIRTRGTDLVPYAGSTNSFKAESYHRLDMAVQFHKKKKKYERFWEFGLFNAYNRKNPFYYYLERENDFSTNSQRMVLRKKSFLPILPSITYNLKF